MGKVIKLNLNLPMVTEEFEVGRKVLNQHGQWITITEIQDKSIEWETHIDFIYDIYAEGQLFKQIVNSPATLTYDMEESK